MYLVTNHNSKIAEWSEVQNLRGFIDDLDPIVRHNQVYRKYLAERDSGRPGHYYGRDVVIEGAMPAAAFFLAPLEFGGDEDWFKDDAKFQSYMARHPNYDWFNG